MGSSVPFMTSMDTGWFFGVTAIFSGAGTLATTAAYARAKSGVWNARHNVIDPPLEMLVT